MLKLAVVNFQFVNDQFDMAISATYRNSALVDGQWCNTGEPVVVNEYQVNDAADTSWSGPDGVAYRLSLDGEDFDWLSESFAKLAKSKSGWKPMAGTGDREYIQVAERRMVHSGHHNWAITCQAVRAGGKVYPAFFANLRASNVTPVKGKLVKRNAK